MFFSNIENNRFNKITTLSETYLDIPNYVTNINLKCLHEGISCARNFKGGFQLVISHSSSEADLFSSAFLETVSMVYVVSVCLPLQLKRCVIEEGLKQTGFICIVLNVVIFLLLFIATDRIAILLLFIIT